MTEEEKKYFNKLHDERLKDTKTFDKKIHRGAKHQSIYKYSDEAHFIYELLQNANDARAQNAIFELYQDKLIFRHNGSVRFNISNPDCEDEDIENKTLGHINAITAVGSSTKDKNEIGKFGIGFKSVFQYSKFPEIYDDNFQFYIDFIVPYLLPHDFPNRVKGETVFQLPFNSERVSSDDAYIAIKLKAENLSYPLLFLDGLKKVEFKLSGKDIIYEKRVNEEWHIKRSHENSKLEIRKLNDGFEYNEGWKDKDNITEMKLLSFLKIINGKVEEERLWKFNRYVDGLAYSVCYWLKEDKIVPKELPAFCYFQTQQTTNLKFIIHAPFSLTDNRAQLSADHEDRLHNDKMISHLADLAADALFYLCVDEIRKGKRYVYHEILDVLPTDKDVFSPPENHDKVSFQPFYHAFLSAFKSKCIIPATEGYVSKEKAYWSGAELISRGNRTGLLEIFSSRDLAELKQDVGAQWTFIKDSRESLNKNKKLQSYIDDITKEWIDANELIEDISSSFMEKKDEKWLHKFYKWMDESKERTKKALKLPIFINRENKAQQAINDKDEFIIFLPTEPPSEFTEILPDLMQVESTYKFFVNIGIKEPALKDEINLKILPRYSNEENPQILEDNYWIDLKKIYNYYCRDLPEKEKNNFFSSLRDYRILIHKAHPESTPEFLFPSELYFPSIDVQKWFEVADQKRKFLDLDMYTRILGLDSSENFEIFCADLKVNFNPSILEIPLVHFAINILYIHRI